MLDDGWFFPSLTDYNNKNLFKVRILIKYLLHEPLSLTELSVKSTKVNMNTNLRGGAINLSVIYSELNLKSEFKKRDITLDLKIDNHNTEFIYLLHFIVLLNLYNY